MPTIYERKSSRFLTKEMVARGMLLTIAGWHEDQVGNPPEQRDVVDFEETDKGLVLNDTRREATAAATGLIEMNDWPGHKIVCYHDPTIKMGGKMVGGIAVRAPRISPVPPPAPGPRPPGPRPPTPRPAPAPVPAAGEEADAPPEGDDVPF